MPWVTIREASGTLKVSSRTIRRMIKAGTLPSRMEGGVRVVLLKDDQEARRADRGASFNQTPLAILFVVYEELRELKRLGYERVVQEKTLGPIFGKLLGQEYRAGVEEWVKLYLKIEFLYDALDSLIRKKALDQEVLHGTYQTMLNIRDIWAKYDPLGYDQTLLEENEEYYWAQVPKLIKRIIEGMKRSLIGST